MEGNRRENLRKDKIREDYFLSNYIINKSKNMPMDFNTTILSKILYF